MSFWFGWIGILLLGIVIFRIVVRKDYLQHGRLRLQAVFSEFLIFGLHANLIYLSFAVPWPQLPPDPINPIQRYSGTAITVIGIVATLVIMAYLGFGTSTGQRPASLKISGPYRWSRNPQLTTLGFAYIGIGILYPGLESAAWILLYAVIAYLMVITEEEHLQNLFGEEYIAYCQNVPRFLPGLKKSRARTKG